MSDTILKVESLSKKFCRNLKSGMVYSGVDLSKSFFGIDLNRSKLRENEFWALNDISFEVKRGESVGLVGINGSGKTTLLRLISGLFPPDEGKIRINGSVASLIAVGAGFHPHLTGRENIFLNAAILGMSKTEVQKRLDWIVDFAEIDKFLDVPVATYSSGMRVRLGFAVASAFEPDLLLLDEILAVGDRSFRVKCFNRIAELQKNCAVIFVSHSAQQVTRVCNRALYLEDSKLMMDDKVSTVLDHYLSQGEVDFKKILEESQGAEFQSISLEKNTLKRLDTLRGALRFKSSNALSKLFIRIVFFDEEGIGVAEWQSKNHNQFYNAEAGENIFEFEVSNILFKPGCYNLSVILSSGEGTGTGYILLVHGYEKVKIITGLFGNTAVQL
jgi:lipopolysaccharide transport system ATP-binding protein